MPTAMILLPALISIVLVGALWRTRGNTEWFITLIIIGGFASLITGQYLGFMPGAGVAMAYLVSTGLITSYRSRQRLRK